MWKHIQPRLPPPAVNVNYSSIDLTSVAPIDRPTQGIIQQADIVTFIKSVSPAVAFLKNRRDATYQGVIPSILREMKSGALLVYIDNSYGEQNQLFYNMAVSSGLVAVHNPAIWKCNIEGATAEYDAVWGQYRFNACTSCVVKGCVFYKQ